MISDLTGWLIAHYGQEQMQPGLSRIREALGSLLAELQRSKIVTVAGTNGKGETTLWLSHYLRDHSQCVWISPHVERITERFRDERGEIGIEELTGLILACHEKIQLTEIKLSYYEFLFYVFCHWAASRGPRYLLLEVGLGGRLDAVNVLDADLVLLPSISRDHQEYLGNRFDLILREKLGLLRPHTRLLSFLSSKYLREKTQNICSTVGSEWFDLQELGLVEDYEFSSRNQLLAYAAFLSLEHQSWSTLSLPGSYKSWVPSRKYFEHRGEVIFEKGEWILYGSHNVDGMRKLIQFLHSGNYNFGRPPFDAIITAFSRRDTRDIRVLMKMLKASGLGPVIVTSFPHPKAMPQVVMKEMASSEGLDFVEDMESLVHGKNTDRKVVVTGSYYFLSHFKSLLCR